MEPFYHTAQQLPLFSFKVCPSCDKEKLLEEFHKCGKNRRRKHCIACSADNHNKHSRDYYARNREEVRQKQKEYDIANAEHITQRHKRNRMDSLEERRQKDRMRYAANVEQVKEKSKARYAAHAEENRQQKRKLRAMYPEKYRDFSRRNYIKHAEDYRALSGEWRKNNPIKRREYGRRYDAHKRGTSTNPVDYAHILELHGYICHICHREISPQAPNRDPSALHFDHVIPLSRHGQHSEENIRPSHQVCNLRKNNRLLEEMTQYQRRGPA